MTISASKPDWSREKPRGYWDPSRRLLGAIRAHQAGGPLRRRLAVLQHRFWSVVAGADIPLNTQIAGGLILPHPTGIVMHPEAEIGPNCAIFQHVTLGTKRGGGGAPRLGGHVDVGPGACILGGVYVGDHAVIGANAVVLQDVSAGSVAVGVPARIMRKEDII